MSQPRRGNPALIALAVGHFVVDVQTSGLAVLVPILRAQLNLDYAAAAAILTAQYLTSSIIQPLFGIISDRRPLREMLPVSCLLAAVGTATAIFMPTYAWLLAVVVVTGLGSAAFHAMGSLNANHLSGANKATGMSVFFSAGQLGYALGPLLIVGAMRLFGPGGALGNLVPGVIGAATMTAVLPLYASRSVKPAARTAAHADRPSRPLSRERTIWGLIMIVVVISVRSVIQTGLITFIPLYFVFLDPANKEYGAFALTVFVFAGALGTLLGGSIADRIGRKTVLVVSFGIVLPLLYVFLNATGALQLIALGLAGASLISAASLNVVMAQELLPDNIGLASGLTLGLGFGAGGLGAAALGEVADVHGLPTTMQILALLPALLVALTLLLPGKPRALAEDEVMPTAQ